jgi:Rab3 GTPase-activating protein catalytic subunit
MRTCLLHQKLQMLNICIERKLLREKNLNFTTNASNYVAEKEDKNDSDDEFYDCDEDEQQQSVDIGESKQQSYCLMIF